MFLLLLDAPEVYVGHPSCSSVNPSPVSYEGQIQGNWEPIALIDKNDTTCLQFPFLDYETIHIRVKLQITKLSQIKREMVIKTKLLQSKR